MLERERRGEGDDFFGLGAKKDSLFLHVVAAS